MVTVLFPGKGVYRYLFGWLFAFPVFSISHTVCFYKKTLSYFNSSFWLKRTHFLKKPSQAEMICKLLQRQWFRSLPKLMGTFTITAQVRCSPSQARGEKGGSNSTRVFTGAPVPWRQAVHLQPAQAILFLLSHQPHHFQSRVPLVGRNLEASRIRVSVPGSLPGAGGQGWLPDQLCDNSFGGQLHLRAILKRASLWNDPVLDKTFPSSHAAGPQGSRGVNI